jgi:hypothetical protein
MSRPDYNAQELSARPTICIRFGGYFDEKSFRLPALFTLLVAVILCCSSVIFAQNREKFVISAKAGGINAITGQADVHAKGESEWQQLSITDDLDAGDRVRTANDGRVEILLNPGSYLRVGGDSEVELSIIRSTTWNFVCCAAPRSLKLPAPTGSSSTSTSARPIRNSQSCDRGYTG